MKIRHGSHPVDAKHYTTDRIRNEYLVDDIFGYNKINLTYSFEDRIVFGGVIPVNRIKLDSYAQLASEYFLENRELGIINLGHEALVTVDNEEFTVGNREALYIGKGKVDIYLESVDKDELAKLYLVSGTAHKKYPTKLIKKDDVIPKKLGSDEQSNKRVIYQYIIPGRADSCQLVAGITSLESGNVWNTMPVHTHDRRMEVYLYFDMNENDVVFHYMGEPTETRHIVMRNEQAVISPYWSIHSGCGSSNYSFVWAMVGENQAFDDMNHVDMKDIK